MSAHLERLARRVADDPSFLAAVLAMVAHSEKLDDDALAAKLGCLPAVLTPLRLCRMPRPDAPRFGEDIERIAARFAVDPAALAEIVRQGQALLCLRQAAGAHQDDARGFLLAARDGPAEPPRPTEGDAS